MPVVSRADCTQVDMETWTEIAVVATEVSATEHTVLEFNACEGIDGNDNDLQAHYELLLEEGIATEEEFEILSETVVGDDNCAEAIADFLG
jgi:hypothetical protein